jgi:hypothetical protein
MINIIFQQPGLYHRIVNVLTSTPNNKSALSREDGWQLISPQFGRLSSTTTTGDGRRPRAHIHFSWAASSKVAHIRRSLEWIKAGLLDDIDIHKSKAGSSLTKLDQLLLQPGVFEREKNNNRTVTGKLSTS